MINKELYKFCGKTKQYIVHNVVLNGIKLLVSIAFSLLFAWQVSELAGGSSNWLYLLLILPIIVVKQLMTKWIAANNNKIVSEVKTNLRHEIYTKTLSMGTSFRQNLTTQELIHLAVEGVEQLESYYGAYLSQYYYAFFSSLILFAALLPFNLTAAIILLIASPIIPLTLRLIMRVVRSTQKKFWRKYADVGNLFLDSITGLTTLKIYLADKKRGQEMEEKSEGFRKQTMRVLGMQLNSITIIDWICYGSVAVAVIVAITQYAAKPEANLFYILALILLAADFFVPMRTLTSLFHVAMTGVSAGEAMLDFLNLPNGRKTGDKNFPARATISTENLNYSYPDGTVAIEKMNTEFPAGKMTAIVGPSGCGKSTLAALLSGKLQAEEGIYLCGEAAPADKFPLGELKLEEQAGHIVHIGHEPHVFAGTVRSNLNLGIARPTDEEAILLLKKMNLWDFLAKKEGLDTVLLSEGKNISSGQRQRLSIAAAILADFDIYIFDEATSGVDTDSEMIILDIIREIAATKTIILISHKMDLVETADYIYVMDKGNLAAAGTVRELLSRDGLFAELYREQKELQAFTRGKEEAGKGSSIPDQVFLSGASGQFSGPVDGPLQEGV